MNFLNWALDRLSEESTWRGMIQIAMAAGITIDPTLALYIIAAGTGLVGMINFAKKAK